MTPWRDRYSARRGGHTVLLARLDEPAALEQSIAATQAGLGEAAFAAVWAEGQATTLEQAVDSALDDEAGNRSEMGARSATSAG